MADDPRINRLDRYRKESDRLILEEHSAGCGGIILRWRNPDDGIPIRLEAAAPVEPEFFLDGQPLTSRRFVAKTGPHLFAVRLRLRRREPRWFGSIAFRDVVYGEEGHNEVVQGLSTADDGWSLRVAGDDAGDRTTPDWALPAFDASDWQKPQETSLPDEEDYGHWRYRMLAMRGAKIFELPSTEEVWIRKPFVLGSNP